MIGFLILFIAVTWVVLLFGNIRFHNDGPDEAYRRYKEKQKKD